MAYNNAAAEKLKAATRLRESVAREWEDKRNNDVVALMATVLPALFDMDRFGLFVISRDNQRMWLEAGSGVTERSIVVDVDSSLVGEVIRNRTIRCDDDLSNHDGMFRKIGEKVGYVPVSAMTAPIFCPVSGDPIGALQVMNGARTVSWTERDRALIEDMCHAVSRTVRLLHLHEDIVAELERLDSEIEALDKEETAIRGSHMLRTFEPAKPLYKGGFLHGRYGETVFPPFIDVQANADLAANWDTDEHDVFICTHQKVGTHLAKKFVVELLREGLKHRPNVYSTSDIGHGTVPWPEVSVSQHGRAYIDSHIARTHDTLRAWYVHCSYSDMPVRSIHPKSKFIVVYRDPKAVAVSQYFFWKRHPLLAVPEDLSMDEFVNLFVEGDLYFGDYHDHVSGWINRSDSRIARQNILALSYEDMVNRKVDVAHAMARFLLPDTAFTPEALEQVAEATEFNKMKEEVTKNPQSFHLNPKVYFRSGTTNDWQQKLSDIAIAAIDEKSRARWRGRTEGPELSHQVTLLDHLIG
jgi:hypothetical protein